MRKTKRMEQEVNNILFYQKERLAALESSIPSLTVPYMRDPVVDELAKRFNCDAVKNSKDDRVTAPKTAIVVSSIEELGRKAREEIGGDHSLEELFTEKELQENRAYILKWEKEYDAVHKLDRTDIGICALAATVSALVNILLIGIPKKTPEGLKAGTLSDAVRKWFDNRFPEDEMARLANREICKVPYDAQNNRITVTHVEGLSPYYHRMLSLGHDPLLGWFFGILDILNGTMTTIDKNGRIVRQAVPVYEGRQETDLLVALLKQLCHLKSDVTTSMGLPAPLMGLFNLFQFGDIGESDQTIAEIVQGMYYEGFDAIHFCAQSVPVILAETIVRMGYACRRLKEGRTIGESIPFFADRERCPKLETMLFVAHAAATAINAGEIYITKDPMSVNYPQWIMFAKYSFKQLKWVLIRKPECRHKYVTGQWSAEWDEICHDIDRAMARYSERFFLEFE